MTQPTHEPAAAVSEHHLTVQRTARYYTLGDPRGTVDDLWIVCHGFAQLARTFIDEFGVIARAGRLIVAPEALNRFYLNPDAGRAGASARVGATWMTREDRLTEIADYVRYLDELHREVMNHRPSAEVRVTALGFSQGTATAARWLVHGAARIDRLVLWAGLLPPEIEPDGPFRERLTTADLTIVHGTRDRMLTADQVRLQVESLERAGVACRVVEFEGGHRLDRDVLGRLGERAG
jgi:predicted esterase